MANGEIQLCNFLKNYMHCIKLGSVLKFQWKSHILSHLPSAVWIFVCSFVFQVKWWFWQNKWKINSIWAEFKLAENCWKNLMDFLFFENYIARGFKILICWYVWASIQFPMNNLVRIHGIMQGFEFFTANCSKVSDMVLILWYDMQCSINETKTWSM